jgi:hypothetical protein
MRCKVRSSKAVTLAEVVNDSNMTSWDYLICANDTHGQCSNIAMCESEMLFIEKKRRFSSRRRRTTGWGALACESFSPGRKKRKKDNSPGKKERDFGISFLRNL